MNLRSNYTYVLKSIKKNHTLKPKLSNLNNKTFIISGASRGIGYNIAEKLALSGANVVITGKTTKPHPKLDNTIYSAAEQITKKTNKSNCLPVVCDVRKNQDIDNCIRKALSVFGSIDGVILNASALCLNNTLNQKEKEVELMSAVNINGTFMMGKKCLKHIQNSSHPHVLLISPPLDMIENNDWWTNHLYYSLSKYNMSLMGKYWNQEFPQVGVNTLWPRTTINTAPIKNILGGDELINISRTTDIMGDAAKQILLSDPLLCNGNNFIDDEVLLSLDKDVEKYKVNPTLNEKQLMPDFFC